MPGFGEVQEIILSISDAEIDKSLNKLEKGVDNIGKKAGKSIGDRLHALTDSGNIAGLAGGIAGGQGGAGLTGQLGGMIGEAVGGPIGAAVGGQLGSALEKAAPAAMAQLGVVMDDISAVIGRTFIPVLEVVTPLFREFGDILATVLPNAGEMRDALGPIIDVVKETSGQVRQLWEILGPLIREGLVVSIKILAEAFRLATIASRKFVDALLWVISHVPGLPKGDLRKSAGASAQPTQFTSFGSYQQNFQAKAFAGPAESLPAKVDRTNEILGHVRDILTKKDVAKEVIDKQKNEDAASGPWAAGFNRVFNPFRILEGGLATLTVEGAKAPANLVGPSKDKRTVTRPSSS